MRRTLVLMLAISMAGLLSLAAVGCSGGGGGPGYNTPPKTPTTGGGSGGAESGGGTPAAAANITIANFTFDPASATVKVGGKVTWKNDDSVAHQVSADDGSFAGPEIKPGGTWSAEMSKAGTFEYFCALHKNMRATIIVK